MPSASELELDLDGCMGSEAGLLQLGSNRDCINMPEQESLMAEGQQVHNPELDIENLLSELEKQEAEPDLAENIFNQEGMAQLIVVKGFDSDQGSMGDSVHDPPAHWLASSPVDSGMDDRMVNLPVYYNNPGTPTNSDQLEYANWLDIFHPGHITWERDMSGSDYGPDGYMGWLDSPSPDQPTPLSPIFPVFPPDREIEVKNPSTNPNTGTPVTKHYGGCPCNVCNRLSPQADNLSRALSFPADLKEVARKLEAWKESELLEVDVDKVHREAEIEEREIIREYQYISMIRTSRAEALEHEMDRIWADCPFQEPNTLELVEVSTHSLQWVDEIHFSNDQDLLLAARSTSDHDTKFSEEYFLTSLVGQSTLPPMSTDQGVDADKLHAEATAEEVFLQTQIWRADQSRAVAEAVRRLQLDKKVDDFEIECDEVIKGVRDGEDRTETLNPPYPP